MTEKEKDDYIYELRNVIESLLECYELNLDEIEKRTEYTIRRAEDLLRYIL